MKRAMKAAIAGIIKISICLGLGVVCLIAGQVGYGICFLAIAILVGFDSYRSYNKEVEKEEENPLARIDTLREIIDHQAHGSHHDSIDRTDDRNDIDLPDAPE